MSLSDRLNRSEPATESMPYLQSGALRTIATAIPERLDIAEVRNQVNDELKDQVGKSLYSGNVEADTLQSIVYKAIAVVIERNDYPLTDSERAELVQEIVDDILGNGPLEQLLRDVPCRSGHSEPP